MLFSSRVGLGLGLMLGLDLVCGW